MALPFEIACRFAPAVAGLEPLGNGLINDTFLAQTPDQPFVLQKINRQVFPRPELIMQNLAVLNEHFTGLDTDIGLVIPALLKAADGQLFFIDGQGDYWRAWSYIGNTDCLETFRDLSDAGQVGAALGRFHRLCFGLDTGLFHDTLPGFHITPGYYAHYLEVKARSPVADDEECSHFIREHQSISNDLEHARMQGLLSEKIIHGDPKLNNFLFDKASRKVVSLIDLDTVKPGLLHYDIGDCLRSCCHVEGSNEFDLDICRAVLSSYVEQMADLLTPHDFDLLYPAIRLIPFELGLRFYTDYLDGNRYFKVNEPEQNLIRARAQFLLCASIIRWENKIAKLIDSICLTT